MRKCIAAFILISSIILLTSCQGKYDSSVHDEMISEIRNEIRSDLSGKVEDAVSVKKMDSKHEYQDLGEINDYRIKIHIKDIDERHGVKYTRQELWNIVYRIDQIVSSNRLTGEGTSSEGAYNTVSFYLGDEISASSLIGLNYFGDAKKTYQDYMTNYYDDNGNPVYDGSYQEEHADEWIHQF